MHRIAKPQRSTAKLDYGAMTFAVQPDGLALAVVCSPLIVVVARWQEESGYPECSLSVSATNVRSLCSLYGPVSTFWGNSVAADDVDTAFVVDRTDSIGALRWPLTPATGPRPDWQAIESQFIACDTPELVGIAPRHLQRVSSVINRVCNEGEEPLAARCVWGMTQAATGLRVDILRLSAHYRGIHIAGYIAGRKLPQ